MKLSCYQEYPGYREYLSLRGARVRVYLDGKLQRHAIAVDDVAGTIVRLKTEPSGAYRIVYAASGSYIEREEVKGVVRIVIGEHGGVLHDAVPSLGGKGK